VQRQQFVPSEEAPRLSPLPLRPNPDRHPPPSPWQFTDGRPVLHRDGGVTWEVPAAEPGPPSSHLPRLLSQSHHACWGGAVSLAPISIPPPPPWEARRGAATSPTF
jgi:hypothetical protein